MSSHRRTEPITHHSSRKPGLLNAIVLAAVVVGVVAGLVSLVSKSAPAQCEVAPIPMTFEPTETRDISTSVPASQSVRETTTARVTVTAQVTDVRVSAAPTATVTSTPAPAPTVTTYRDRCWVWDDNQVLYVERDCDEASEEDDEALAHSP
jgi:hypothetical protein